MGNSINPVNGHRWNRRGSGEALGDEETGSETVLMTGGKPTEEAGPPKFVLKSGEGGEEQKKM